MKIHFLQHPWGVAGYSHQRPKELPVHPVHHCSDSDRSLQSWDKQSTRRAQPSLTGEGHEINTEEGKAPTHPVPAITAGQLCRQQGECVHWAAIKIASTNDLIIISPSDNDTAQQPTDWLYLLLCNFISFTTASCLHSHILK